MGIKRKVQLGFWAIGALFFLSGVISSLELARFSRSTQSLLTRSHSSIDLSKQMLDAAQKQNTALLLRITGPAEQGALYDSLVKAGNTEFEQVYFAAEQSLHNSPELTPIHEAARYYNSIVDQVTDSTDVEWFTEVYQTSYSNLTHAIKEFMVQIQQQSFEHTAALEQSAYRASMVGIISLAAGILLMLVFYFMINNYFIRPILQITSSLRGYILSKLPFEVKIHTRDELLQLRDHIAELIATNKKKSQL